MSIIGLPTKWILSAGCPRRPRWASASGLVANSRSASRVGDQTRLISSGMVRSKLRRPASTCASGMPQLGRDRASPPAWSSRRRRRRTSAAARLEQDLLQAGHARRRSASACVPEPDPEVDVRLAAGRGRRRTRPTWPRRSAGRCARASASRPRPASARASPARPSGSWAARRSRAGRVRTSRAFRDRPPTTRRGLPRGSHADPGSMPDPRYAGTAGPSLSAINDRSTSLAAATSPTAERYARACRLSGLPSSICAHTAVPLPR